MINHYPDPTVRILFTHVFIPVIPRVIPAIPAPLVPEADDHRPSKPWMSIPYSNPKPSQGRFGGRLPSERSERDTLEEGKWMELVQNPIFPSAPTTSISVRWLG